MTSPFSLDVFDGVYSPAADTYLLIDTIKFDSSDIVLDVGCGAGLATLHAAQKAKRVVSIDISHKAVKNTIHNLRINGLVGNTSVVQSDLFTGLSNRIKFSLIMFNPPYLPADDMNTELDHALIGGERGSEMTERFIVDATSHIAQNGRLYVIVSTLEDIDAIIMTFEDYNFQVVQINETPLFFEKIQVLKGTFKGYKETVL